jgi:hypothetical protein
MARTAKANTRQVRGLVRRAFSAGQDCIQVRTTDAVDDVIP